MKKVILTIVVLVVGIVSGNAQNNTSTSQTSNESVVRITDGMSSDDIGLEFINNFYKIELSDMTTSKKAFTSKSQNKKNNNKGAVNVSGIILDLAVRTTNDMRPSLYAAEELSA